MKASKSTGSSSGNTAATNWLITAAVLALLSGCARGTKPEAAVQAVQNGESGSKTTAEKKTGAEAGSQEKTSEGEKTTDGTQETKASSGGADKVKVDLNSMPDTVAICTVAGNDITIGDYKRMLRIQQSQANQTIISSPAIKAKIVQEAKARGIELSKDEKSRLLAAAHKEKGENPAQFQDFLKKHNATEQQFDAEVLDSGLAFKTSNIMIESTLLPDLVQRELLAQSAQESGGEKAAMNKYLAFKHSKNYEALLKQTGLTPEELRDEMVKQELAKQQLAKLEAQIKISEADLKKVYEANKKDLTHGDRIRLSTILVMCPEKDIGPISSVRTQLLRANPKLSGKELDVATAQYLEQSKQRALILLGEARGKPSDFAKLANQNSMDPETVAKKNGGDMGFLDKNQIVPQLSAAVWNLKAGEVLPQVVKSELGYNLYRVTAKEKAGVFKYEEVKPLLQMQSRQNKMQQALAQWMAHRQKVVRVEFSPKFRELASKTGKSTQ